MPPTMYRTLIGWIKYSIIFGKGRQKIPSEVIARKVNYDAELSLSKIANRHPFEMGKGWLSTRNTTGDVP